MFAQVLKCMKIIWFWLNIFASNAVKRMSVKVQ